MALPFYDRVTPRCGMCRRRKHVDRYWKWHEGRFVLRPFCVDCEPSLRPEAPTLAETARENAHLAEQVSRFFKGPKATPKATCPGCKRLLSLRKFHPKKINCALCKECSPNAD